MSDAQQQQQQRPTPSQTPASTTPSGAAFSHPSAPASSLLPLGSSSATIDVTEEFSNEQIDAFLSANPDFAARALDEAARGLPGAAATAGWDAAQDMPMDGRARPGQIDSQRMASGAGGGWIGSSYQAGSQFSMNDPSTFSPPNSLSPDKMSPSPPEGSTLDGDDRSLSPFSSMMAQAGVPPVPTLPTASPQPFASGVDALTPPPSSVSSGGSTSSGEHHRHHHKPPPPIKRTIMERRLDKQRSAQSAPSEKTIPQVGRPVTGLYSSSGFDVLGALSRVVSRPNPRVNLGPVDFSCSFLVVDVRKEDCPIVYSSPTFSVLTGYENKEILGKNCRFLQGPDGQVAQGSRRKYTDNVAVSHLKRNLSQGRECQASLINYRKDGSPFINLVTVVPIPWDTEEIAFHVGFQVDLVESPNAILKNITDGTYQVNYQVLANAQNPLAPAAIEARASGGKNRTLGPELTEIVKLSGRKEARDAVTSLERAQELGDDEADDDAPEIKDLERDLMMEWYKSLAEHSDDFIHVLSLKGQFQYVSPSVRRVLDYEPEDLMNKFISDICHPSDVVPIMRELKDSTQTPPPGQAAKTVNFLCRVERKTGETVWLECTGRLYIEPGKGRKAVILSGRERVMPKLEWSAIGAMGGIGGGTLEGWGMMSFEGLVLYANNELKDIFGVPAADGLLGESLLDFIPPSEGSASRPPNASGTTTVSPAILNTPFQEPIHQRMLDALKLASRGQPAQSGVTIRHQIVVPCGALAGASGSSSSANGRLPIVQEVATTIYAIQRDSREYLDLASGTSPGRQQQQPHDGGGSSRSPFGSENTESFPIEAGIGPSQNKLRQTALVFQVKLLSARPQAAGQPPRPPNHTSFQTAHEPTADVFEALDTNRSTGWTYELHQLKIENRRLKERIAGMRAGSKPTDAEDAKSRRTSGAAATKRKRDVASSTPAASVSSTTHGSTSQSPAAAMPPPPLPIQQHQQAQPATSVQQQAYTQSWAGPYGSPVDYVGNGGGQQYSTAPPDSQQHQQHGYDYSSPPTEFLSQMAYSHPQHGHGPSYGGNPSYYDSYR